jgi:hypothetical protein
MTLGRCNNLFKIAKCKNAAPADGTFAFVRLYASARVFSESGYLQARQRVTVNAIVFIVVVDGNDVRFAISNTAQPCNSF